MAMVRGQAAANARLPSNASSKIRSSAAVDPHENVPTREATSPRLLAVSAANPAGGKDQSRLHDGRRLRRRRRNRQLGGAAAATLHLRDDRGEGCPDLRAKGTRGADDGECNQGGNEAMLDGRRTRLVLYESSNEVLHDHSPTHSQLARLRSRLGHKPRG